MNIMCEALDIPRQAIVKLGTQEADFSLQKLNEVISSICKVAKQFNNVAHNLLPEQTR